MDWRHADAERIAARDDLIDAIDSALATARRHSAEHTIGPSATALFTFALGTVEQVYLRRLSRAGIRAAAIEAGALVFRRR